MGLDIASFFFFLIIIYLNILFFLHVDGIEEEKNPLKSLVESRAIKKGKY